MCGCECMQAQLFFDTPLLFLMLSFFLSHNMFCTSSPTIASSYSRFNLCQWKNAIEMLIVSKLCYLLAFQLRLLHILICESTDCKTVHCNISRTLQSLFGQSINSPATGQFWDSILFTTCQK